MMRNYEVRVRMPQGGWADIVIRAGSMFLARQLAEAQYGAHNVVAVLGEAV